MYFTNYYVPVSHTNSQVELCDIPIIQYYRDIFTHNYRNDTFSDYRHTLLHVRLTTCC